MALVPCRECGKEISTEADACPHCGCPARKRASATSPPPADDDARISCYSCGSPASRACTRCGAMCCEEHITWWGSPYKNYGATCSSCASFGWVMSLVGLVVVGIIALVMFSSMRGQFAL